VTRWGRKSNRSCDQPVASISHQPDGVQKVANEHRFENVQLEMPIRPSDCDGSVVPHNLGADHRHGFALRWVNLARHDRRPGFVLGKVKFAQAASWAGTWKGLDLVSARPEA
jgi:hypothetical protein